MGLCALLKHKKGSVTATVFALLGCVLLRPMKRTIAAVLVVLLLATLVACNKKDDETQTTVNTTLPVATTTAPSAENVSQTSSANSENPTYILTTQHGQTMPTVVTTLFNLANEITTQVTSATEPSFEFTVPSMSAPEVVSEKISTTVTTTSKSEETEATKSEETEPEETTKPDSEKERKYLDFSSAAYSESSKNISAEFSSDNWNGGIKTSKISGIKVSYDGVTKEVSGYVRQSGDYATITIYTSDLNIPSATLVSFTVPAGSVVSKKGDQTNMAYSASISTGGEVEEDTDSE